MEEQKIDRFKDYNRVLSLDDKYGLHAQDKKKVKQVLEQQVQYLLDKKEKQNQKKKRIQQMEDEFQRKRKSKIEHLQQKIKQSQKAKQNIIKVKLEKNKKNLQYVDKVNKKAHNEYNQIVQKGFLKRKQFYSDLMQKQVKFRTRAETQQNFKKQSKSKALIQSKLNHSGLSQQFETHRQNIQVQMRKIDKKNFKANNNQRLNQEQTINRINQKNRHYSEIHQKIRSYSIIQEQKNVREVYDKNQHIIDAGQKIKELTSKHLNDRRRSFQNKIKRLHQNIKYMESEKQQKFASLENKFNKMYQPQLSSRIANKSQSHRQRVMMNNIKLSEQKNKKADQILKKHSDITAKNKIYKEKKDQILQAVKKANPQLNE